MTATRVAESRPEERPRPGEQPPRPDRGVRRVLVGNVLARIAALVSLASATIMVARVGDTSLVGALTLLRVLPGLVCVLAACGLPGAAPYFLGTHGGDPRLRPTLICIAVGGSLLGAVSWLAMSPVLYRLFFDSWTMSLVIAAAAPVGCQLFVAVGKACLQGGQDLPAANVAIVAEELSFLPIYAVVRSPGNEVMSLVIALTLADIVVALGIAIRLHHRGFFRGWKRPSLRLGKAITAYGLRGQIGGLLTLVNLRLDVALLGAIAGPSVLGVYSVASKYAELLRLPGLALNYVLYPLFTRWHRADARKRTRALLPAAVAVNAVVAVPLALAAATVLPLLYGAAFRDSVVPTWILLGGLLGEGAVGMISAYLYGIRRPGLNSLAIGTGVLVTVLCDLLLIPRYGAIGAATASAIAYATTVTVLLFCFIREKGDTGPPAPRD